MRERAGPRDARCIRRRCRRRAARPRSARGEGGSGKGGAREGCGRRGRRGGPAAERPLLEPVAGAAAPPVDLCASRGARGSVGSSPRRPPSHPPPRPPRPNWHLDLLHDVVQKVVRDLVEPPLVLDVAGDLAAGGGWGERAWARASVQGRASTRATKGRVRADAEVRGAAGRAAPRPRSDRAAARSSSPPPEAARSVFAAPERSSTSAPRAAGGRRGEGNGTRPRTFRC